MCYTYNHGNREAGVERNDAFELLDLLVTDGDIKCLHVGVEMLDFTATNDWEHEWGLMHQVGNGNCNPMSGVQN